jgi:phospholipase/carboxylesterase
MLKSEFIPAQTKDSRRLLIALHGLGDSPAGYRWMPDELALPEMNYILVRAPDPYYEGFSWFDISGDAAPGVERSRALLFDLLDAQVKAGFPTAETILFGFSQGCLLTADVGFRYPHTFAGLIAISGWVHEPDRLLEELSPVARAQRMLFTHGTQDPMVPCAKVREQVKELNAAGLHIEWREFAKAHTIAGREELAVIRDFITARFQSA